MSQSLLVVSLMFFRPVITGFYISEATSPPGSIVHTQTASEGCKILFPESTWDDEMRAHWHKTGQHPVVCVQTSETKDNKVARYSCLRADYFSSPSNKKPGMIGPFYLHCKEFQRLAILQGPLIYCTYSSWSLRRKSCREQYAVAAFLKHLQQSPEDAVCVEKLVYHIQVSVLRDECQDLDYRGDRPKTIIAWATHKEVSPVNYAYWKVINPSVAPHDQHYQPRMNASRAQTAVVISPAESPHPLWQICYYARFKPPVQAMLRTTLNIGYLDFDFHWTGIYTANMPYVDGWAWQAEILD